MNVKVLFFSRTCSTPRGYLVLPPVLPLKRCARGRLLLCLFSFRGSHAFHAGSAIIFRSRGTHGNRARRRSWRLALPRPHPERNC
jgi:hypothetical protein